MLLFASSGVLSPATSRLSSSRASRPLSSSCWDNSDASCSRVCSALHSSSATRCSSPPANAQHKDTLRGLSLTLLTLPWDTVNSQEELCFKAPRSPTHNTGLARPPPHLLPASHQRWALRHLLTRLPSPSAESFSPMPAGGGRCCWSGSEHLLLRLRQQ